MVIVFPLMAHGNYGHGFLVLDLEQRNIAGAAKRNHQFAQKGIFGNGLAAGERKLLQQLNTCGDGLARVLGGLRILLGQEGKEPFQILFGFQSVANPVVHLRAFFLASASMPSSSCSTSSAEK